MSVPTDLVLGGPRPLRGTLRVPGDKGISHRALLFAAMAVGESPVSPVATTCVAPGARSNRSASRSRWMVTPAR